MTDRKDFIKVRVWRILRQGDKLSINENTTFNASDDFSKKIYDGEEQFRAAIITFINDAIGLHNWATTFTPFSDDENIYDVKVYADNEDPDAIKIKSIIEERITDKELNFSYGGTIDTYLKIP